MTRDTKDSRRSLGHVTRPVPTKRMPANSGNEPDHHSPVWIAVGDTAAAVAGAAAGDDGVTVPLVAPTSAAGAVLAAAPESDAAAADWPRVTRTAPPVPAVEEPPGKLELSRSDSVSESALHDALSPTGEELPAATLTVL